MKFNIFYLIIFLTTIHSYSQDFMVGTGIHTITDPGIGLGMQGMSDEAQITGGVESELYSRAFVIRESSTKDRLVLVNTDLWSCTGAIKEEVIKRLIDMGFTQYSDANVMISGTHNHSGPGGYSDYKLYNLTIGGFDQQNFECIVSGIVKSIRKAHNNLAIGRIYYNIGTVDNCGRNRSKEAYFNNILSDREKNLEISKTMQLLKFVQIENGKEVPVGVYSFYGIHPTNRSQYNTLVNGDNKGYASYLFEKSMHTDYSNPKTFVAAFANSTAGDVSPNIQFEIDAQADLSSNPNALKNRLISEVQYMRDIGNKQYTAAKKLFSEANQELKPPLNYKLKYVDFKDKSGSPACLGLSMAAGSTEDSKAIRLLPGKDQIREGITRDSITPEEKNALTAGRLALAAKTNVLGSASMGLNENVNQVQRPKPILFAPGATNPQLAPNTLPLQLFRIGFIVIAGLPAEFTTHAGRLLRSTLKTQLKDSGVKRVAINCYANQYAQYVATGREYVKQHYEGASTLFGKETLNIYRNEFSEIAKHLSDNDLEGNNMPLSKSKRGIVDLKRITIRNKTSKDQLIHFYKENDNDFVFSTSTVLVPGNQDIALTGYIPPKLGLATSEKYTAKSGNLFIINSTSSLSKTNYSPPEKIVTTNSPLEVSSNATRTETTGREILVKNLSIYDAIFKIQPSNSSTYTISSLSLKKNKTYTFSVANNSRIDKFYVQYLKGTEWKKIEISVLTNSNEMGPCYQLYEVNFGIFPDVEVKKCQ